VEQIATDEGIFGQEAIKKLAAYLPIYGGVRTLLDYRRLASAFDRKTLEQTIARPMDNGRRISLYHVIELSTVKSPKKRGELIDRVRTESLTVDALRKEITGNECRSSTKRGGGRKQKTPISVLGGLHDLATRADKLAGFAGVFEPVCERIETMPPGARI
jgi:hypothetical protein